MYNLHRLSVFIQDQMDMVRSDCVNLDQKWRFTACGVKRVFDPLLMCFENCHDLHDVGGVIHGAHRTEVNEKSSASTSCYREESQTNMVGGTRLRPAYIPNGLRTKGAALHARYVKKHQLTAQGGSALASRYARLWKICNARLPPSSPGLMSRLSKWSRRPPLRIGSKSALLMLTCCFVRQMMMARQSVQARSC